MFYKIAKKDVLLKNCINYNVDNLLIRYLSNPFQIIIQQKNNNFIDLILMHNILCDLFKASSHLWESVL